MAEYLISNYGIMYNRRFYPCPSLGSLAEHWNHASEHHFMRQAFAYNHLVCCYEKLTPSMVEKLLSDLDDSNSFSGD